MHFCQKNPAPQWNRDLELPLQIGDVAETSPEVEEHDVIVRFTENVAAVQNNAQRLLDESRIKAETLETLIEQNNRLLAQMSGGTVTKQAARPATAR